MSQWYFVMGKTTMPLLCGDPDSVETSGFGTASYHE